MSSRIRRREFLKRTVLTGAGLSLASGPVLAKRGSSPNEKLNIGIIGTGHRAVANTNGVKSENIVALCDVDSRFVGKASERFGKAKTYDDWRKCLEQKDIDAVVISTTDHTHALIAVAAMKLGKHVYCEKPLAHSVHEARVVRETYAKYKDKIATQMGTQIHATENYRRVVELVQSGAIGAVREAHVWCGRVGAGGEWPKKAEPVPKYLNWDLWIGPAPARHYSSKVLPRTGDWNCMAWNRYWDYEQGTIGDMGSHLIDLPFWALDLRDPTSAEGKGTPVSPETCSRWLIATWEHPARGNRPAVKVTWYDADKRPKSPKGHDLSKWGIGVLFDGDKGQLVADYGKHILLPEEKYRDFQRPKKSIAPSLGHYKEWIHACKTGAPTLCNFDYSGALIEHNLLGNVAYRVGQKLTWDAKNLKAVGCAEADRYIHREYRKGWTI